MSEERIDVRNAQPQLCAPEGKGDRKSERQKFSWLPSDSPPQYVVKHHKTGPPEGQGPCNSN